VHVSVDHNFLIEFNAGDLIEVSWVWIRSRYFLCLQHRKVPEARGQFVHHFALFPVDASRATSLLLSLGSYEGCTDQVAFTVSFLFEQDMRTEAFCKYSKASESERSTFSPLYFESIPSISASAKC
jgi:hypothetical protein